MYEISLFAEGAGASQVAQAAFTSQVETMKHLSLMISTTRPWSPGVFVSGRRLNANLQSIGYLVLDVDEGCSLAEAIELFAPYKHVIGTSKSHGIEKAGKIADRFRVVLMLPAALKTDAEFKAAWYAAKMKWAFIDSACKDAARFFFPCKEIVSVNDAGALFAETFKLPDSAKDWSYQATGSKATEPTKAAAGKRGKLSKQTKDFLAEGAEPGTWHARLFKAATDFKEQGYDIDEARLKFTAITGDWLDVSEHCLMDVYENRESKYGPRVNSRLPTIDDWPDMTTDAEGNSKKRNSEENIKHLLGKLGYVLYFNEMDGAIYVNGERTLTDEDIAFTWTRCDRYGIPVKKERFMALMLTFACEQRFHPIKDAIEARTWDGVDHIAALFGTITIDEADAENADLYRSFLSKWLVGVVAKIYRPGSQNLVLTLQGPQGYGKSRWFARFALWNKAFGEGAIDPSNKDHEIRHLSHLIWHIPELDYTTGRRETGALKDYLTKDFVAVRPAWARTVRHGRSVCSFCASVNAREFLVDQTGNRRFLVIPIANIDAEHAVDMQQVLAQAKSMFEAGFQYWVSRDELGKLNESNEDFEIKDTLTEYAESVQVGEDEMTVSELLEAFKINMPTHSQITRFGAVLIKRGFKKVRRRYGPVRKQIYKVRNPSKAMGFPTISTVKKYDN